MKLKRLALLAIALCLVCMLLPGQVQAAALSGSCGADLTWTLDEAGVLTVSGTGAMTDYAAKKAPWYAKRATIQAVVVEEGVTAIGNNAFYDCTKMAQVSIPLSVTAIGDQAFYNCAALTEAVLPQNLAHLGSHAFYKCKNLNRVQLPAGLTKINHYTFYGCSSLAEITIPDGVVTVGGYAFFNCSALEKIIFPASVEQILSDAFSGCTMLREVTIPQTIQLLGTRVFNRCSQLQDIYYGGTLVQWLSLEAANRPKATYIHYSCQTPEDHWFEDMKPATCTAPGYECVACSCGYTKDKTPIPVEHSYSDGACLSCGAPEGLEFTVNFWSGGGEITVTNYEGAAGTLAIPSVIGGYSVTEIGASAFENCSTLVSVTLPDSVKNIRDQAFRNCSALTQIQIPDNTVNIGYDAFYGCGSLTQVRLPAGLLNIGSGAFGNCAELSLVIIPESVTDIGTQAFAGCQKLTEIYYGGTLDRWNSLQNKPSVQYVHYTCTAPDGHWATESLSASCQNGDGLCTSCSCGYAEYQFFSDPLGHQEVTDAAVAASCTAAGKTEGKHCSICGAVITPQQEIPATGHTEVTDKAVAATCTAAGKTEGKHCDLCGTVIAPQQNIPATGHTYDSGVDGTCNNCGIHRETTEDRTVMHMFRMYDPNSGEHFYTGSEEERENLVAAGWNYEGVGFTFSRTTGLPVYRLYDPITGEHLYTMQQPVKTGTQYEGKDLYECEGRIWLYEGIAFNSAYDTEVPQYRLRNPNASRGAYHFTSSAVERDNLIAAGWISEGICFYSSWK